ncbi:MAG: hypothetical protein HYY16_01645 [Planctomycetes bacterium]|nr:hypothetical protein [Planctomycetota bacterium]
MHVVLAIGVLLALQEPPRKYLEAAAAIELPQDLQAWRARSPQHARAVAVIADLAVWARGLQLIDERLGLFAAKPRIKVIVKEDDGERIAKGGGRKGVGEVHFNLRPMVEYVRTLEEIERMRQQGKDLRFRVPPTPISALIHHELAHCFAGTYDDLWLTEGLAAFAAGETAHLWDFQNRRAVLRGLDKPMSEADAYARGLCALSWMEEKFGSARVKAFVAKIVEDRSVARKALEEATGLGWEALLAQEVEWSRAFLEKFTPDE